MKLLSLALTSIIAVSSMLMAHASDPANSPLIGRWVLCQDQDGGRKDSLQFFPEGYGFSFSANPDKPKSPFLFKEAPGQVMLAVNAKGSLVTIYLGINSDSSQLTTKSERTGNESFYVREGEEQKHECAAA